MATFVSEILNQENEDLHNVIKQIEQAKEGTFLLIFLNCIYFFNAIQ